MKANLASLLIRQEKWLLKYLGTLDLKAAAAPAVRWTFDQRSKFTVIFFLVLCFPDNCLSD